MTAVEHVTRILPGSTEFDELLRQIAAGAKDRDLNDENPFDQVAALKRAGFGALRLPEHLGGAGFTVPELFSTIIDVARADPIVAHIFRTHFWFVEERLRTADDASSQWWLHKVAKGKIFGNAFSEKGALSVGSLVFNTRLLELGGASAASRQRNLDRHWRNIRTITLHNPVAYKARVIGQNLLHGTPVPANAYF